jgi:Lar family restriction alleviation protein
MSDAVKLLPCPFCGGEAEFQRRGTGRVSCVVDCTECGASHSSSDEGDRSGTSWNRRAAEAERDAALPKVALAEAVLSWRADALSTDELRLAVDRYYEHAATRKDPT